MQNYKIFGFKIFQLCCIIPCTVHILHTWIVSCLKRKLFFPSSNQICLCSLERCYVGQGVSVRQLSTLEQPQSHRCLNLNCWQIYTYFYQFALSNLQIGGQNGSPLTPPNIGRNFRLDDRLCMYCILKTASDRFNSKHEMEKMGGFALK